MTICTDKAKKRYTCRETEEREDTRAKRKRSFGTNQEGAEELHRG